MTYHYDKDKDIFYSADDDLSLNQQIIDLLQEQKYIEFQQSK